MKRISLLTVIASIIILLIAGYAFWRLQSETGHAPFTNSKVLDGLQKKDASGIDTSHLAAGLTPPTNKWFSGLALQKVPKVVFPTPLSFTAKEASFSFSLPKVAVTKNTISSDVSAATTVEVKGATHYQVTRYDELSVDLTYGNNNAKLGTVTLVAGSPYIYFHAHTDATITVESTGASVAVTKTTATFVTNSTKSTMAGFEGVQLSQTNDKVAAVLPQNGFVTFYSLPSSSADMLRDTAGNRIIKTNVSYQKKDKEYQTSIDLVTQNNQPTYHGLLPHQIKDNKDSFGYDTIYGRLQLVKEKELLFSTPEVRTADSLDMSRLNEEEKAFLVETLRREINATQISAEDTYFGGKEMYRSAQLLVLANQVGEKNIASSIQQKLRAALAEWLSVYSTRATKFFYYDTKMQGIVGETASFGSREFNDHHFHYGYFIYAASILAKYDPDFLAQYAPMVNLLVADIANYRTNEQLPLRRSFDPYFGHSWASGSSPFNDGNNQESSSEAINAWIAVGLWGQQINDSELVTEAGWMLSNEIATTSKYWMNFDVNEMPYSQGYDRSLTSLNWGGKRDYATFFSADPNAILGILLIPMNPTMIYQSSFGDRIARHVDEAIDQDNYNVQFGDYIMMYDSLQKKTDYLEKAKLLPDKFIDGANSRSYMYAWIMSLRP